MKFPFKPFWSAASEPFRSRGLFHLLQVGQTLYQSVNCLSLLFSTSYIQYPGAVNCQNGSLFAEMKKGSVVHISAEILKNRY